MKFGNQAVSVDLYTLLKSGIAAFKDQDIDTDKVYIKNIKCDEGPRLKRRRIVSKGRATAIQKRMCHLIITLSDTNEDDTASNNKKEKLVEDKDNVKVDAVEKKEAAAPKAKKFMKTRKTDVGSKEYNGTEG